MKQYDAVIIGGGPAGLAAAERLAARGLKTVLIEKEKIGARPRSWIARYDELERRGFKYAVINKITSLKFRSFLGAEYSFERAPFAILDTKKALNLLKARAENSGCEMREQEEALRYREEKNAIIIESTGGEYGAAVCVDASGAYSAIQEGLSGKQAEGAFMGCYAVELAGLDIKKPQECLIFDAAMPGKDYFWFLPYNKQEALVGCFFFEELNHNTIQRAAKSLQKYMELSGLKGRAVQAIQGNIPLMERRFYNHNRVFFCGDSASSPLPSSGFGFLRALQEGEMLGNSLQGGASQGRFSWEKEVMSQRFPGFELHYMASDILKNVNDPLLAKAINRMNHAPGDFVEHFLLGDDLSVGFAAQAIIEIFNTFTPGEIASMALRRNYREFLLHIARVYPRVTPAVLKKTAGNFIRGIIRNKRKVKK